MGLIEKLENSWKFWIGFLIVVIFGITLWFFGGDITSSIINFPLAIIYFPLGIVFLFGVTNINNFLGFSIIGLWYLIVGTLIFFIVKDKSFNKKLILALVIILLLTIVGCTKAGI